MARMIDQLLDLTRARIGRGFELQPIETDLAKLCAEVVAELELAHPTWRMQVRTVGRDFVGTWDPDRLLQVVSNLLVNAGRHGASGHPFDIELGGTEQHLVRLDVHNAGAIPEALLPNIFSPFRGTRSFGSLGLGLFITKEIIVSHGGTVEVASSEAMGTTFRISLPRHCPRQSPNGARANEERDP